MPRLFSSEWISALERELAGSEAYRRAAARWEGEVVLAVGGAPEETGVYLDLHRGECRAARLLTSADRRTARFVLVGSEAVWKELAAGSLSPATAVMGKKLELERGSVFSLMPHLAAAQELLAAALRALADSEPPPPPPVPPSPGSSSSDSPPTASPSSPSRAKKPRRYRATGAAGLDRKSLPLRLWEKAKVHGVWNPTDLDFATDREHWQGLSERERELLLHLAALFGAGEESVVLDLLPLMQVIAAEGRLEEEMFLTAFLFEEAKHVDLFRRFFDQVAEEKGDLERFHGVSYAALFGRELPAAMGRLQSDASPEAQAIASTTYNLVVEGVLAETGYHAYHEILSSRGILPGMLQAVAHLKRDESRHLAYGVYLLSRLVAEHGEPAWAAIVRRMDELLPLSTGIIREAFERYGAEIPFGLDPETFVRHASTQFSRRLARIESVRRSGLDDFADLEAEG